MFLCQLALCTVDMQIQSLVVRQEKMLKLQRDEVLELIFYFVIVLDWFWVILSNNSTRQCVGKSVCTQLSSYSLNILEQVAEVTLMNKLV